jgi:hypothetical protein
VTQTIDRKHVAELQREWSEMHYVYGWLLLAAGRTSSRPGAEMARRTAERILEQRGWTLHQVSMFVSGKVAYPMPPRTGKKPRLLASGAESEADQVAACTRALVSRQRGLKSPVDVEADLSDETRGWLEQRRPWILEGWRSGKTWEESEADHRSGRPHAKSIDEEIAASFL